MAMVSTTLALYPLQTAPSLETGSPSQLVRQRSRTVSWTVAAEMAVRLTDRAATLSGSMLCSPLLETLVVQLRPRRRCPEARQYVPECQPVSPLISGDCRAAPPTAATHVSIPDPSRRISR